MSEMNFGIVILLVLIIFILFVQMVLSAIAADNANSKNKDDLQKTKTCSTAAAVTAGLSVLGLVIFLVLYIMNTKNPDDILGNAYLKAATQEAIRGAAKQERYITKPQAGFYEEANKYIQPTNIHNDNNAPRDRVDINKIFE